MSSLRTTVVIASLSLVAAACGGSSAPKAATDPSPDAHAHAHDQSDHSKHGGPAGHGDGHAGHGMKRPHGAHEGHAGHGTQAAHGPNKDHGNDGGHGSHRTHKGHASHGKSVDHVHKGPLGHRFKKAEDWVPRFEGPQRDAWQKPGHVVAVMAITPGMVVADIGAGTGYFLPHLSKAVGAAGKVWGLDIEPDMVRYMKRRATRDKLANVDARLVATDDPKLDAASMDRVLVVDTWHHIADRAAYAKKIAAGLKPGGAVYVVDFTMDSKVGPPVSHRLKAEVIRAELEAGGLTASIIAEQLPNQYIVVGRRAP